MSLGEQKQTFEHWWDAFPAPRSTAPYMARDTALSELSSPLLLLVDVRRTDYEGGTIAGSLNIPAHSFYLNRGVLYNLVQRAGVKRVTFYCGSCTATGRGTRCANWFADYLEEKGESGIESFALEGGIKAWAQAGADFTNNMDGYDAKAWG